MQKNAMRSENVPHKSSTIPVDDLWITPAPDSVWPLFATRFTVWIIYFHQCNSYDIKCMLDFLKLVDSEHISENMFRIFENHAVQVLLSVFDKVFLF